MSELALVAISNKIDATPGAFHERGAALYLGMNRIAFRELVFSGVIPYTTHSNGIRRIYLRSDLDAYLSSLDRRTINARKPAIFRPQKGAEA
jgi:hypothetical protein